MIFNTVIAGSGGHGETVVEAKAVGIVTGAIEDDKVILIPTDIIAASGDLIDGYTSYTHSDGVNDSVAFVYPGARLDYTAVQGYVKHYTGSWSLGNSITGYWDSNYEDFDSVSDSGFDWYVINYRDDVPFAASVNQGGGSNMGLNSIGIYENGQYTSFFSTSSDRNINYAPYQYIKGHYVSMHNSWNGYSRVGEITGTPGNWSVTSLTDSEASNNIFMSKYNNAWYLISGSSVKPFSDLSTTSYSISLGWSTPHLSDFSYVDDDVDYIFIANYANGGFFKINKSNSTWTTTRLSQPSNVISSAIKGGIASVANHDKNYCYLSSQDFGTYVDIYMATAEFGYNPDGNGNKIAHFKFTKATEIMERLDDIFTEIDLSDFNYQYVTSFQVNWTLGIISVTLTNRGESSRRLGLFVKKFDDMAGIYKYFAVENVKGNYYADKSITGFVKSNEGTDDLGNTIVKVKTAEDPNYIWTPPVGRVFGMNVTVNEGEPV